MTPELLVVDASAVVHLLLATDTGERINERLFKPNVLLHSPDLLYVEVFHVLRKQRQARKITRQRANDAYMELSQLPIEIREHIAFLPRIWGLLDNIATYDAVYVALAEDLDATLVTTDGRLSRTPRLPVRCEVFSSTGRKLPRQAPRRRAARAKPRVKRSPTA